MKRIITILSLCLVPFFLGAQQLHTSLDILRPSHYALPDSVLDLIVVNNTVPQPINMGHSTKREDQVVNQIDVDLSKAATYLLLGATQTLDESLLFASVGFVPESQNRTQNIMIQSYLPVDTIQHLCYEYQADAALVCNRLLLYDVLGSFLTEDDTYYAYLEVYLVSTWTLQLPNGHSQAYQYRDTLYWEAEADTQDAAIAALPVRQDALLDMCLYSGERFGRLFIPTWETVDRYFYENNNEGILQGLESLTRQRWEEAINVWKKVYEQTTEARKKKDKFSHAYAAANIAVAYEIMDELTQAHLWAEKAVEAFAQINSADAMQQGVNMQYYAGQLTQRINENQR